MKIEIRTRHLTLTPETRQAMHDRLALTLARISSWIRAVVVTVTDINGPRGGADKQCRLVLRGRGFPRVVIEHVGVDTLATIAAAADRAEQVVVRKMTRHRRLSPSFAH